MNEKIMLRKLISGVKAFFKTTNATKAVLGLSGGMDSALVAVIAARALGPQNVYAVALPTKYNSKKSFTAAKQLAQNLKINFNTINIDPVFDSALSQIKKAKYKNLRPLTVQNLQPRIRALMLMAVSAETGGLVLTGSNRSEIYAGYSTLYGDTCGALSPLGSVYKTGVYALARYINKDTEIIPDFIISRPPSAELAPNQKDSDELPDYAILDQIYRCIIDQGLTEKQTATRTGADIKMIRAVMLRKKKNAFKQLQAAPVLKI